MKTCYETLEFVREGCLARQPNWPAGWYIYWSDEKQNVMLKHKTGQDYFTALINEDFFKKEEWEIFEEKL